MKHPTVTAIAAALLALCLAAPAQAGFGVSEFDVTFTGPSGEPQFDAGSHPFAMTTTVEINTAEVKGEVIPDGDTKDIEVDQVPGFVGSQAAAPTCSITEFLDVVSPLVTNCPDSTAVGVAEVKVRGLIGAPPVYNLKPAPGSAARLGFVFAELPVLVSIGVSESPPYNIVARSPNISQILEFFSSKFTIWGVPADSRHDEERGRCAVDVTTPASGVCPAGRPLPFLTLPRACEGPLTSAYRVDSWQDPGAWLTGVSLTHNDASPPNPQGMVGCGALGFAPSITAKPTTRAAESSTGLDFSLDVNDEGLQSARDGARAQSDIRKAVVTLPEGMTANPSSAEGLGVCSEAQLAEESSQAGPGGCPDASKLGTIEVQSPLIEQSLAGSLYLAEPYRNPFGTLLALYMVFRNEELGIFVKQPLKVEPDSATGRLVTTAEDIPQLPFSHFKLHFREGARSPLVSPPACGPHDVVATLYPWSGGPPVTSTSTFEIVSGNNGAPCPPGGTPPFEPGFEAGSNNNSAGGYSPFYMRLTRRDGDQDLTKFSAKLPPGMVARLAGTARCSEAAIAQARSRSGAGGGREELERPSCPADSQIGRVMAGAGVGSVLTYVPGRLYLAGPHNGAPLSVVAIVPALAGPFDVGTVVTREALRIDPLTAEVEADGSSSDPIPHILAGIPLKVRDIRVYVDRPDFTINPTNCNPSEVGATLWGGGANVFSSLDDSPQSLATRFQAANCASLGFKPRLALQLRGGTRRGGHPALRGIFRPRKRDANLSRLVLRLPHSAFLDQGHIRTICTRVQFAAGAGHGSRCPKGARYGYARAWSPLLEEPLQGPVFLRSSNHNLPDFVAALHGLIDVEAVARIDSKNGGIRATFPVVPDAPLSRVAVNMQGGKKGLIVNSTGLCRGKHRADARFAGHNGRRASRKPVVRPISCRKSREAKRGKHHRRARAAERGSARQP